LPARFREAPEFHDLRESPEAGKLVHGAPSVVKLIVAET
jgi:hypothetical protein